MQAERMARLIEYGYFDFFGLGTDRATAEAALLSAIYSDHPDCRPEWETLASRRPQDQPQPPGQHRGNQQVER